MAKLKVNESCTVNELMPKLLKLKNYDATIEKKRKQWGWIAGASAVATFLGLFLPALTRFSPLFVLAAIAGPLFVVAIIVYIINVRKDLDNRKLNLAVNFVEHIGQDIPSGRDMNLFIDFGKYTSSGTLVSKEGGMFSVRTKTYEHPWFRCSGALYDGNRFELKLTKCVKRKEKPKRKYTKIKERIVEKATLNLKLNPRIYPAPPQVAELVQTGHLPHGITVSRALGRDRSLKIVAVTPPAILITDRYGKRGDETHLFDGDKLLGLIIDAYAGLQKARPAEGAAQA